MEANEPRRTVNVRITNRNLQDFEDMHNGKRYVFLGEGKTLSIPLEAANHIFGYSLKDSNTSSMFEHMCRRWGWNTPENVKNKYENVKELFANFDFTPVACKWVEQAIIDTAALADAKSEGEQPEPETEKSPIPDLKLGKPMRASA